MAEVLSQSEVESLLAALDPRGAQGAPAAQPRSEATSRGSEAVSAPITLYDFKRPERVSKEQMRTFHALHEGFGREFGAALSGMVRSIVEVKLISVDQLTYGEFIFSLENPTCFNLLRAEPFDGHFVLDLNPSIIFPIVDRLLGGGKMPMVNVPRRPLTEIELRLISRITDLALAALRNAWSNVCDLRLKVLQIESNPHLVQVVPPNEVVVLVCFEITMGEMRGLMNLCIPYNAIEPVTNKLSANIWASYSQKQVDPRQKQRLQQGLSTAGVQLVVNLASTRLTASEVLGLAVGDVIVTQRDRGVPIDVCVEGRPKFRAFAGLLKGHKAVRIAEVLPPPPADEGTDAPATSGGPMPRG